MYKHQRLKDTLWSLYGIYASPSELSKIEESLVPVEDESYLEVVMKAVCNTYGLKQSEIKSKSRKAPIPEARKVFCFLCVSRLLSVQNTAEAINLDRSTVSVHAKEVFNDWPKFNKDGVRRLNLVAEVLGLPDQLKFVKAGADL